MSAGLGQPHGPAAYGSSVSRSCQNAGYSSSPDHPRLCGDRARRRRLRQLVKLQLKHDRILRGRCFDHEFEHRDQFHEPQRDHLGRDVLGGGLGGRAL